MPIKYYFQRIEKGNKLISQYVKSHKMIFQIYKKRRNKMNGLNEKEVLKSREQHGSNKLPEPKLKKWYEFAKEALSEK